MSIGPKGADSLALDRVVLNSRVDPEDLGAAARRAPPRTRGRRRPPRAPPAKPPTGRRLPAAARPEGAPAARARRNSARAAR